MSERGLVYVFAFVPMPNHIHHIWCTKLLNFKEIAQDSFFKFTAHTFKKLLSGNEAELSKNAGNAHNRKYEFWQRDSLAIHLYTIHVLLQKLNYIPLNSLPIHPNFANNP